MIFLFWDKDSISKNISWRSRTVLTSHKKKYKYFKLAKNLLPHHRMQMEIFGYMSRRIWICFLSSFFWGNCAAIQQKNNNLYICMTWDVPQNAGITHLGMLVNQSPKTHKFWKNYSSIRFHALFPESRNSCVYLNIIYMV